MRQNKNKKSSSTAVYIDREGFTRKKQTKKERFGDDQNDERFSNRKDNLDERVSEEYAKDV